MNDDFEIKDGVLVKYRGHGEHIVIPDCVTCIGFDTFYNCRKIKSVTIPNGVTSIGAAAFDGCWSLCYINIPSSVTYIGDTFLDCDELTVYSINDKWKELKNVRKFVHGGLCNQNNRFV